MRDEGRGSRHWLFGRSPRQPAWAFGPIGRIGRIGPIVPAAVLVLAMIAVHAMGHDTQAHAATRWESGVAAYEKRDAESPPPQGATVFVGSSSIRIWNSLPEDFAPVPVIGRGIGGCEMSEVLYYADRLIFRYHPRQVVVYAGDNDIADHKKAGQILSDFRALVGRATRALPQVRLYFLSIKPSPSRVAFWTEDCKANQMVRLYARKTRNVRYVDVATPMLDAHGKPRPELFQPDMLHMNRAGYEIWIPIIKSALAADESAAISSATRWCRGPQNKRFAAGISLRLNDTWRRDGKL